MMPVKTFLKPIDELHPQDMVIAPESGPPLFEGMEEESLACETCQAPVTEGVSTQTLHALFQPPGRLIYHCDCGVHAEVPAGTNLHAS